MADQIRVPPSPSPSPSSSGAARKIARKLEKTLIVVFFWMGQKIKDPVSNNGIVHALEINEDI
uniref:Uncharacterized protein n=1 Tax=Leersia perrieri TaxID=77586 RepID=A0A0D9WDM5_9ORYZ